MPPQPGRRQSAVPEISSSSAASMMTRWSANMGDFIVYPKFGLIECIPIICALITSRQLGLYESAAI